MSSEIKLEEAAYFDFVTHRFDTGAVTDADSTPTAEVFEDATDTTVVSLTVTKRTSKTGNYRVPVTAAAADGFEVGKTYNIVASATVNSVAGKGVIGRFKVRTRGRDDLAYPATSGRSMVVDASGLVDANTVKLGPTGSGTAQTARDLGTSVLLSSGTGTGQLDFTSGVVKSNLAQILGTALTETAGLLAGAFKKFFNVATPTGTVNSIPDAVAGAAGGLFIAGTNAATTVTTSFTTTFTGNLTGSVASVSGAVGSVGAGGIAASSFAAGAIDASAIAADAIGSSELAASAANEIADALLDRATAIEGYTPRESLRLILAALAAKLGGAATTTISIRDIADSKDRIVATVDASGNRTAITLDAT